VSDSDQTAERASPTGTNVACPWALDEIHTFSRYLASAYGCDSVPVLDVDEVSVASLSHAHKPLVLRAGDWDELSALGTLFTFAGQAGLGSERSGSVGILDPNEAAHEPSAPAPPHFAVLAIVPTYNEGDIIERTLEDLLSQGLHVHVLDN